MCFGFFLMLASAPAGYIAYVPTLQLYTQSSAAAFYAPRGTGAEYNCILPWLSNLTTEESCTLALRGGGVECMQTSAGHTFKTGGLLSARGNL